MAEKSNQGVSVSGKGGESQAHKEPAAKVGEVKLVRMVPAFPEEMKHFPSTADVHPDEVAKWSKEGWKVAE